MVAPVPDPGKKKRKIRRDKGSILATERDLYCIAWIAEMTAVRVDQVRHLLSRFPDPKRPFKDQLIAETTMKDQINRWLRAGWIVARRVLADEPQYVWVTKAGLRMVGLDDLYRVKQPAELRLHHYYGVAQVRLMVDRQYTWKSERRYRAEELEKVKGEKDKSTGPIPDGVVTTKDGFVAVEVEVSKKKAYELEAKISRLLRHIVFRGGYEKMFFGVWFYVATDEIKDLVEDVVFDMNEKDQERVWVVLAPSVIALKRQ